MSCQARHYPRETTDGRFDVSYERREIAEIKWISGHSNPADAMTKSKPCPALKELIDTNRVKLEAHEWVERDVE